jgi:hypothetical protein
MVPRTLTRPTPARPQPKTCRHGSVEHMTDKRGPVRRNRGFSNSSTGPSYTNKKLQEIYFEAAKHRWAVQKMWKRTGDNPAHYCGMWATGIYRVCKKTWWSSKFIHQKLAEAAELIEDESPYYRYTPANVLENNFKLYWNRSIITDKTIPANRPDITLMNKKKQRPLIW